jgi:3,4-dihydroxy-2-butanone 4-phosphate synthase
MSISALLESLSLVIRAENNPDKQVSFCTKHYRGYHCVHLRGYYNDTLLKDSN